MLQQISQTLEQLRYKAKDEHPSEVTSSGGRIDAQQIEPAQRRQPYRPEDYADLSPDIDRQLENCPGPLGTAHESQKLLRQGSKESYAGPSQERNARQTSQHSSSADCPPGLQQDQQRRQKSRSPTKVPACPKLPICRLTKCRDTSCSCL